MHRDPAQFTESSAGTIVLAVLAFAILAYGLAIAWVAVLFAGLIGGGQ